jgi:glycosyltransferase involved in cell wall biosynthesis
VAIATKFSNRPYVDVASTIGRPKSRQAAANKMYLTMNLFVSRNPPNDNGPGGSQRAMHLLRAVARHGPVDFILIHRDEDTESVNDSLEAVRPLVRTCRRISVSEWASPAVRWPHVPWKIGQLLEAVLTGTIDAPKFSAHTLQLIKDELPQVSYDVVFAARLSSASIVDDLIENGHLNANRKVLDLDDLLSRFKQRELDVFGYREGHLRRIIHRLNIKRIMRAEQHFLRTWDAVGVASADDAKLLRGNSEHSISTVPNVTDRPELPLRYKNDRSILFVGNLSYSPNIQGLTKFLLEIWPIIRAKAENIALQIVGTSPNSGLVKLIFDAGARLDADVESLEPFYEYADVVIAPIWQGGGTRIKILEAMAYGRPVISTAIGAEGLGVKSEEHVLIADTPVAFAAATLRILNDPELGKLLVENARTYQQQRFSPKAIDAAVDQMILGYGE